MLYVWVKYVHLLALMILVSSLVLEHRLIKSSMSPEEMRRLAAVDLLYGISAMVVLVAGLVLWFVAGKGAGFYTANPIFHAKLSAFVLVGLLSIYPTIFFMKNRKSVLPSIAVPKTIVMIIRFELFVILLLPLLAILMAQGYGIG
jgi:putative membrane protein